MNDYILKVWTEDQQSSTDITQELVRNAKISEHTLDLLNKNLHLNKDLQVIHMHIEEWAAHLYAIFITYFCLQEY